MDEVVARLDAEHTIKKLEHELQCAKDVIDDFAVKLDMLQQALGVSYEPHQTLFERTQEAAEHPRCNCTTEVHADGMTVTYCGSQQMMRVMSRHSTLLLRAMPMLSGPGAGVLASEILKEVGDV